MRPENTKTCLSRSPLSRPWWKHPREQSTTQPSYPNPQWEIASIMTPKKRWRQYLEETSSTQEPQCTTMASRPITFILRVSDSRQPRTHQLLISILNTLSRRCIKKLHLSMSRRIRKRQYWWWGRPSLIQIDLSIILSKLTQPVMKKRMVQNFSLPNPPMTSQETS